MVKGVNKNIIEISDTGNDCFERAILFVRPESADKGDDHLYRKAKHYLTDMRLRPRILGKRRRFFIQAAKLTAALAVGATAALLLIK